MMTVISHLFAVMLLLEPEGAVNAEMAAAISADADRLETVMRSEPEAAKTAVIRSRSSEFDRQDGVVMFEGNVSVTYSDDYSMCADRLFMFLVGSNEVSRVVAVGNVTITNDTRVGTCAFATYRRRKSEIEMFGQGEDLARLADSGEGAGSLQGSRIRFWLDSEQVEVEDSSISLEKRGEKTIL